jgi:cytochrome c553
MKFATILLLGVGFVLGGCGSDDTSNAVDTIDCSDGKAIPAYADLTGLDTCAKCHGVGLMTAAERKAAPVAINFDDYASAVKYADKAVGELDEGAMPPANSNLTLSATEINDIKRWATCGTPE